VIDTSRNHQLVHRAIDALHLVSDDHQRAMQLLVHPLKTYDQRTIGQLLKLSRTTDTLERILGELHALLDHPPSVGSAEQPRMLPRPVRTVDGITEPGLAMPAASDGGPAAA
jgi:hypothetical protein